MNRTVRSKTEMAIRVRDFLRAQGTPEPGQAAVLAQLDERLERAQLLLAQQRVGRLASQAATNRRKGFRETIHRYLLHHLVPVGEVAGLELPNLAGRFRLPRGSSSGRAYLTAARTMHQLALVHRERFQKLGLAEGLLADLGRALEEYEVALREGNVGRQESVGATAELDVVMKDLMELADRIGGMVRYRYQGDPEKLRAWEVARDLTAPPKRRNGKREGGSEPGSGGGLTAA